jgi:hypothetical protein
MKNPLRLDSISENLANSLRQAGELQRRRAASAAAQVAASRTGLRGNEVDAALEIVRRGGNNGTAVLRRKLEILSADLDDQYLRLGEEADEESDQVSSEALLLFRKARSAAALAFACASSMDVTDLVAVIGLVREQDNPGGLSELSRAFVVAMRS